MTNDIDIRGGRPSANAEDNSYSLQDKTDNIEMRKYKYGMDVWKKKQEKECLMVKQGLVTECKMRLCEFYDKDCEQK